MTGEREQGRTGQTPGVSASAAPSNAQAAVTLDAVTLDAEDYEALMAVLATYERLADIDPETTRRMRLMERMHSLREGVFNRIFPVFVIGYCINVGLAFSAAAKASRVSSLSKQSQRPGFETPAL